MNTLLRTGRLLGASKTQIRFAKMGLRMSVPLKRGMSSPSSYDRPGPPRLPSAEQAEFEELVKRAEESPGVVHPDARQPLAPEFEGDVNPTTGERGGPKREPVRRWNEGDWSYKGRVSDF